MSVSILTRMSQTGQKFSEKKKKLLRGTTLYSNIALIVHTQFFFMSYSALGADIDIKMRRKNSCFFMEKQKRKKTDTV